MFIFLSRRISLSLFIFICTCSYIFGYICHMYVCICRYFYLFLYMCVWFLFLAISTLSYLNLVFFVWINGSSRLSIHPCINLTLCGCPPTYLFVRLPTKPSINRLMDLSIYPSIHLCILWLQLHLSIDISICTRCACLYDSQQYLDSLRGFQDGWQARRRPSPLRQMRNRSGQVPV